MATLIREGEHLNIELEVVTGEGRKIVFLVPVMEDGRMGLLKTVIWDDNGQPLVDKTLVAAVRAEAREYLERNAELVAGRLREIRAR